MASKRPVIRTGKSGHEIIHAGGIFFNSYLVSNCEKFILIDGGRKYFWKSLKKNLDALGVNRDNLAAFILTHTHFDHAENAARIKEVYGARIIVHESEAAYLERGDSPLPAGTVPHTRIFMKLFKNKAQPMFRYAPAKPDIIVGESFDLGIFGFNARIIHTPGHTKGSISVIADEEAAFTGDNMVGVSERSIFPPFGDDIPGIFRSWKTLLDTGCRIFIPVHGRPRERSVLERHYARSGGY